MENNNKRGGWPITFIVKSTLWVGLIVSFPVMEDAYKKSTYLSQMGYALNTFLTASILLSVGRFILIALYNRRSAQHSVRGNFVLGINRVTVVLNAVFGIISLMIAFGINPKDFVTSMTIVAMAIAVTFREYITNMISGLILMFSDQFSVGDRIKVGEYNGKIVDITLANIVVKNDDDDIVLIPNNAAFTEKVVNKSVHQSNKLTVRFELPLQSAVFLEQLEADLKKLLKNHPEVSWNNEVMLKVIDIGKDYVKYKIEFIAINSTNKLHRQLENEVLVEVLKYQRNRV
ncbi:mechanosensitive ion channel family protein [Sphingobacterium sp. SYP-B4668]|uniref:mechanosensitive ion channel family protein n=1 Tax=Sphingobacterium sp. SYP-B4668 TaxID=2996035 RepID=UPI0022DD81EC|nr:mechanosensitive ion channel domain-containing protein [Sphingobacterium sp. SYP-B4668]